MKVHQLIWKEGKGWKELDNKVIDDPQVVMFFGSTDKITEDRVNELQSKYPQANIVGCSTAGEIVEEDVHDDSIVATAMRFDSTEVKLATAEIQDGDKSSVVAGREIGKQLKKDDLKGVFIISDGLSVNGSDLVEGLTEAVGRSIPISGGLAGDGGRFEKTGVWYQNSFRGGVVSAIGFYGDSIELGHGSVGGWDEFGPLRKVTKSSGNELAEIDGEPALDLYKKYLGDEHIANLPGSALLFPIVVYPPDNPENKVVRTVLAVNEQTKTMTFAGDVPEGWTAQLMRANFDNLVSAAGGAGEVAQVTGGVDDTLALLVSCVGRKMVLGQRTADEVESVSEALGGKASLLGFYSYGEISPIVNMKDSCALHNQTMTVTVLTEKKVA